MSRFILLCLALLALHLPLFSQEAETKALIEAVERNEPKAVQSLLKSGADVHLTVPSTSPFYLFFLSREMYLNGLSNTMAHEAVYIGAIHANASRANEKILKLLLKKRANIDAGDSEGKTPLMYALRSSGGEAYALLLIRKGANYTTLDNAGNTAMHYAAFGGNMQGVQMTLTGGTEINSRNHQGITPLHAAAVRADIGMMQAMIDLGADIHAVDSLGFTVLHYAAGYANVDKLSWILQKAPDLQRPAEQGHTPLDIARLAGNTAAVAYLRSKGGTYNEYRHQDLIDAIMRRDAAAVQQILSDGANPNRKHKTYPIHLATQNGDLSSMDQLMRAGADPDRLDAKGRSPLDIAIQTASAEAAMTLLRHKAKPNITHLLDALGEMSSRETSGSWEDVALAIIPQLSNFETTGGPLGIAALHYAAYIGHGGIVDALLAAGANPAQLDASGWSALHWAVIKRDLLPRHPEKAAIARTLLDKGCPLQAGATKAKELPNKLPYLAKRIPANANATDLLQYALPKDAEMAALLQEKGGKPALKAADFADNGQHFYFAKDYTPAMAELNKALQAEPANPTALYLRGECKRQLSMLEEAERDFSEAIKYAGPQPEINLARGHVRHDLGKCSSAISDFDVATRSNESKAEAMYWRGRCHLKLGNRGAGCDDLKASAALGFEMAQSASKLYCQ